MAQLSNVQMAQAGFAERKRPSNNSDKYHPHCNEEHRHKPTKALIGIALLIVLSFLLYGITGKASEPNQGSAPHHMSPNAR